MKVLTCPKCKAKLYILLKDMKQHELVKAEYFKPYAKEVKEAIPKTKAKCSYCDEELLFWGEYIVEE